MRYGWGDGCVGWGVGVVVEYVGSSVGEGFWVIFLLVKVRREYVVLLF